MSTASTAATKTAKVLVLNSGSSSIKYQLIDLTTRARLAGGLVERIGEAGPGRLEHSNLETGATVGTEQDFPDHTAGMAAILNAFAEAGPALDPAALTAVGHRVVHGGERFDRPALIDDEVVAQIKALSPLAPLHNPANLVLIEAARRIFPEVPQIAVFDTAFHQTLPPAAYTYAVPEKWRGELGVRRYGFHGTSHQYVSRRAAELLGRPPEDVNVIVLHLGNGASATAVAGGRSVDTSMGLTPLEGLVMGTRSGDVDPALPAYLARMIGLGSQDVDAALNKESGMLALAGSNDMRDVEAAAADGDEAARLALDVYCHRLRKYIGAYYATLGRVDAVVFTAGVGENAAGIRARSLAGLGHLGMAVDAERNAAPSRAARRISPDGAAVAVLVVPTDEEIEIAEQALAVVEGA